MQLLIFDFELLTLIIIDDDAALII